MNIIRTNDFDKAFKILPKDAKRLYWLQEERFTKNWRDSRLHIKKVRILTFAFSFRITRRYRVFFYFKNADTAVFFELDHRKDIYRNL